MSVSTHVLDARTGRPAVGLTVMLWGAGAHPLANSRTDADGRIAGLAGDLETGVYRLVFDTEGYLDVETFYPEVVVTFRVTEPTTHLHVPLLLSPYAYSTYRGS